MSNATVKDIMSSTLASLRAEDRVGFVSNMLEAMAIHAAPVVDELGRPLGVVSRTDLAAFVHEASGVGRVGERMTTPVLTIAADAPVEAGEAAMVDAQVHHLVVVDDEGRAVGMLSALDCLRLRLGRPQRHAPAFDPRDAAAFDWDEPRWLVPAQLDELAPGPGALVITDGEALDATTVVWAEYAADAAQRLREFEQSPPPSLRHRLHSGPFSFRVGRPRAS